MPACLPGWLSVCLSVCFSTQTNNIKQLLIIRGYYTISEGRLEVKLPTVWTDEKQRWEESAKRREEEDQKRESLRRKRIQVREKVGKSRKTAFFQ